MISTNGCLRRHAFTAALALLTLCAAALPARSQVAAPQDPDRDSQRLVVNADGSINYIEPFGSALENRLEYHSRPRPTVDLYMHRVDEERKVTFIDYNGDGKADFIHVERMNAESVTDMVGLYRGPMHKIHEAGHLDHALKHRFILGDSTSARELRERLDAIHARVIADDEIGVFSGYGLFAELRHPVIRGAFDAADELSKAISRLTNRSLKQLDRIPNIVAENAAAVQLLLSINPHNLAVDPAKSDTSSKATPDER